MEGVVQRRERPKRLTRHRLARCAVRHAVPVRYRTVRYHYDFNGNRTATVLPDGRQINYLYYGSGHLHQISLDDEVITDIERDKLHREIFRTQGKLASRYELDPLGRLKRQIATLNDLTEGGKGKTKVAAGYNQTAVKRSYGYDRTGNLTHSTDQRTGTTQFEYDKLGRITQAGNELFAFDPAHNILDIPTEKIKPYPAPSPVGEGRGEGKTTAPLSDDRSAITDNRLKTYNGTTYYYDELGNLIHRELADGEVQNYFYDLHDQLVKAEIFKKDGTKETWSYTYDALGRRMGKGRLKNEEVSETSFPHDLSGNNLENHTRFVWDGSHLLQEIHPDGRYTYLYADQDSYEPLAQVRDWTTEDDENRQQTHYFHCDQIGIPREMTDKDGNLLWFGNYTGWGRLKEETRVTDSAYQPFRLQNQYADRETGLHYNFFRYYEPDAGRFVNQDPIGLMGGDNLYQFALNTQKWIDSLGLSKCDPCGKDKDKLPGGTTVKDFEASLVKLPPGERVAKIKSMAEQVASSRSWTRAKNIERLNPKRTIYTDGTNFYSLDTQHGRFEKLNKKGKHMGEVDMCLNEKGKQDSSGGHDIRIK